MTVIGGADGPAQVYLASDMGWINWFGLIILVLLFVPNIIWAIRHRNSKNACTSRVMNVLEQIGRYGCMFLMVFHIGLAEFGFASPAAFILYLVGNSVLLLCYWSFWIVYDKRPALFPALMLAILPTLIFLLCGAALRHWLLFGFAVLFGFAHIYITACNNRSQAE